jgi:hypothetical protein
MAGRTTTHYLASACAVSGRWKALANGVHTGGLVRGPGLRGTACTGGFESYHIRHPAAANWRRGVCPAGKLLTALLGERLRRSQLAALATS